MVRQETRFANIGGAQLTRRLASGVTGLGVALVAAVLLAGESLLLRSLVFLPLVGGMIGVLQYRERT